MPLNSVYVGHDARRLRECIGMLGLDWVRQEWSHRDPGDNDGWEHQRKGEQLWWDSYVVHGVSLTDVRVMLPILKNEGKAHRFFMVLDQSSPSADLTEVPVDLCEHTLNRVFRHDNGTTVVEIRFGKWVSVHAAMLAAMKSIQGKDMGLSLQGLRVGISSPRQSAWAAGDPLAMLMIDPLLSPAADDIYAVDVILGSPELEIVDGRATPLVVNLPTDTLPPVDIKMVSPRGYRSYANRNDSRPPHIHGLVGTELDVATLNGLRDFPYVRIYGDQYSGQNYDVARIMSQLAVGGVPMLTSSIHAGVRELLGPKVFSRILAFSEDDESVLRESKSIDMRRDAHEVFGPLGRWNPVLTSNGRPGFQEESVSAVLATRRPHKIAFALEQLARQSWPNLEVVLALHGIDATNQAVRAAVERYPGRILVREASAETVFGDVLNLGVEAASGSVITKFDDDDWYGEHHIRDLVHAKRHSGAVLVGTQVEFVYLESLDITTRRPPAGERFSDHVAGGTMLITKEDLRGLGNWRSVHRAVDRCLLQAVRNSGGMIYRGHGQNYLMHRRHSSDGTGGHTWNPGDGIFLQNVAEQWDGFVPPPQMANTAQLNESAARERDLRSFFSN